MLSCEEALEQMSQALDGPLTGEEQGELEAHLASCPGCREDWAALRELHQAMGDLEETQAPEGFAGRVMDRIREEVRPAKVVPLWRRPQWKAAAGLAACVVICVGLYHSTNLSGVGTSGNIAAEPDLAQWSEDSASSGAATAADEVEAPVQGKLSVQPEAPDGTETAGAPQGGAAGGESVLEGAAVPRTTQIQGQNAVEAAPEPALADGEAGGTALYSVQQEKTELLLTALPEGAAELLPALDQWELDGQGRSFCMVSAQTLEALCKMLEEEGVPFQKPEQPWSENCRVVLAE
ncbi:MAG: zf-HC2 domain-containing protein, partial [Oscillospiraceae bacterium]|nr:zf-HC2 domain-containing protein [Oscillospiraceae bacterium]